jgi:hypothetical protein
VGYVGFMGEIKNVYKILFRRPEGKKPLKRPRHKWKETVRMDLQETDCESFNWINLA